jgi:hypothetical protein
VKRLTRISPFRLGFAGALIAVFGRSTENKIKSKPINKKK